MSARERARTAALALCGGAAIMATMAALVFTRVVDLDLDDSLRQMLTGLLCVGAVFDLVIARVLYQRISAQK